MQYFFNLKKIFGMSFSKLPNTYLNPITTGKIRTVRKIYFLKLQLFIPMLLVKMFDLLY